MITTYYIPPENISENRVFLPDDEARHAVQVLRHQAGDEIIGVDGCGGAYKILLTEVSRERVAGEVLETKVGVGESEVKVILAAGILKNQKRFEVFVEKACELGISHIIPLHTQRTEKPSIRKERLQKILIAAMKQCGRSRLVEIADVTPFKMLIEAQHAGALFMCHERALKEHDLLSALHSVSSRGIKEVLIAVGPEGGFSEKEVEEAESKGFEVISLGQRRLRAETAAITACAGIMLAFESQNSKTESQNPQP